MIRGEQAVSGGGNQQPNPLSSLTKLTVQRTQAELWQFRVSRGFWVFQILPIQPILLSFMFKYLYLDKKAIRIEIIFGSLYVLINFQ